MHRDKPATEPRNFPKLVSYTTWGGIEPRGECHQCVVHSQPELDNLSFLHLVTWVEPDPCEVPA